MNRLFFALCALIYVLPSLADGKPPDPDQNWYHPDPDNLVLMRTTRGVMIIELAPLIAPRHVERFRTLVRQGKYDGTAFHRVIDGFMAQGGDVDGGSGLPDLEGEFTFRRNPKTHAVDWLGEEGFEGFLDGFPVASQPDHLQHLTRDGEVESWVRHCRGIVSMARTSDPNSANSQFFLMRGTSTWLDREYTAFGRILVGSSVPGLISGGEPPKNPDRIISAELVSTMAKDRRPEIAVARSDGRKFKRNLEQIAADSGDICGVYPKSVAVKYVIPDATIK